MVNIAKILNISNSFKNVANVTIPLKPGLSRSGNVINFVEKTSRNKIKFQFSERSAFYRYPEKTQKELQQFCQQLSDNCKDSALSFFRNLGEINPNYEYILKLINNPKDFSKYTQVKSLLGKKFVPGIKGRVPEQIRQNLAMMSVYNPESYKSLVSSKGFKEISDRNLDILYLKDIKPGTKVDGDFFYNLFNQIEKNTASRLQGIKGLNSDLAQKYIKSLDKDMCLDAMLLEKLLRELEQSKNTELINKIFKKYENEIEVSGKYLRDLIKTSEKNPKLANKVLDMTNLGPVNANRLLKDFSDNGCVISEDMFDFLVKYQQKNADIFHPDAIRYVNKLLNISDKDEKFLRTLLKLGEDKKLQNFNDVFWAVTPNNLNYLKYNVNNGKLDDEVLAKLKMMSDKDIFKNPENWRLVDTVYKETYLPVHNLFKDKAGLTFPEKYAAENLSDMRINYPEKYKKIEDLGILDLIKQKKINPRIICGFSEGRDFTPEVYTDLKMLQNGESIVKKFDNFDKIFTKTKTGDVISVKGQLYINNNGRLERWNMTEEKFNELFPLVDRYTTMQGRDDCYLISAMDSMYRNPKSRGCYYKMFEQKGDDIYVTIPAYKDFKGEIKFPNGEVKTTYMSSDGAKHIQMVEQTYARTALRNESFTPIGKDSLTTDDLYYLAERNRAGHSSNVLQEVLLFNNKIQKNNPKRKIITYNCNKVSKDSVHKFFDKYSGNPDVILNIGLVKPGMYSGHAMYLKSYDPETKIFQIIDPSITSFQQEFTLDKLTPELFKIWKVEL